MSNQQAVCGKPPKGWRCTREAGHDGPCAAIEVPWWSRILDSPRKHAKYASYIIRHKWFVFLAGLRVDAPLIRLIIHDWTKMLPCEWVPYANYFYGSPGKVHKRRTNPYRDDFERAWLHHIHLNKHHWNHFVLVNEDGTQPCLAMPEKYIREMVADWMGAGRAIKGRWEVTEWYANNRDKIKLHPDTRKRVEELIDSQKGEAE